MKDPKIQDFWVCYLRFSIYSLSSKGSQNEEWVDTSPRLPYYEKIYLSLFGSRLPSAMFIIYKAIMNKL